MLRLVYPVLISVVMFTGAAFPARAHKITFCEEAIPVTDAFVATKLMNIIKRQIPSVTLATLRLKSRFYFPIISAWLKQYGLPDDLKYIPIVECGFRNLVSKAGARGFWQIMPEVAPSLGLIVTSTLDQRDDPVASTRGACQLLRQIYTGLKQSPGIKSWSLTAAAYNFGIGNIRKTVRNQGKSSYFQLQLNDETAEYVYKLIAVKELFEHPELYMNGFGTNVFSAANATEDQAAKADVNNLPQGSREELDEDFSAMVVDVDQKSIPLKTKTFYLAARIKSDGKAFRDGAIVKLELLGDLRLSTSYVRKGNQIKGHGWLIDNRVFVDVGYGYDVEILDKFRNRGLSPEDLRTDDEFVTVKAQVPVD